MTQLAEKALPFEGKRTNLPAMEAKKALPQKNFTVRVAHETFAQWEVAAELADLTVGSWVKRACLAAMVLERGASQVKIPEAALTEREGSGSNGDVIPLPLGTEQASRPIAKEPVVQASRSVSAEQPRMSAKEFQEANSGKCLMQTPRGTKCKYCQKVHA